MGFKLVPKKTWKGDTEYEIRDSSSDSAGALALAALVAFIAFLVMNAHWIMMGAGGAAGAWTGAKISSKTIQDTEGSSSPLSALLILSLSVLGGGIGYVQGNNVRAYFQDASNTPQQAKPSSGKNKLPETPKSTGSPEASSEAPGQ